MTFSNNSNSTCGPLRGLETPRLKLRSARRRWSKANATAAAASQLEPARFHLPNGSAYLVETKAAKILVDCGMFQGGRKQEAKNRPPAQRRIQRLDAVLITHGEEESRAALAGVIGARYDLTPVLPGENQGMEL